MELKRFHLERHQSARMNWKRNLLKGDITRSEEMQIEALKKRLELKKCMAKEISFRSDQETTPLLLAGGESIGRT